MCVRKIITTIISTVTRQQYQWQGSPYSRTKSGHNHPHSVNLSTRQALSHTHSDSVVIVFAIGVVIVGVTIVFNSRLWLAHPLRSPHGDCILPAVYLLHSRQ